MGATEDLLLLVFIMFLLSIVFGSIPLVKCNVEPYYMNLIATFAAGLLMGTAFILIIPEGIELLLHPLGHEDESDEDEAEEDDHDEHDDHEKELNGPMMGLAIIAGIVLMILVNRISPGYTHGHGHGNHTKTNSGVDVEMVVNPDKGENRSTVTDGPVLENHQKIPGVTIGLLMHSIFDGVSLGIVTAGDKEDTTVSWVVFWALMAHKAPEAISLSLILLAKGFSPGLIMMNLLLLAITSPILALIAFAIVEAGRESTANAGEPLGYCLLFAGGTFIGVIFEHLLPDLKRLEVDGLTWLQLLIFIIGALVPLLFPVDHGH